MKRALDVGFSPEDQPHLDIYTYLYEAEKDIPNNLSERVYFGLRSSEMVFKVLLTADEARLLASHLTEAADMAAAAKDRRESFDRISEELRDADTPPACFYAHPDVHYVPDDRVAARMRELEASGAPRYIVIASDEVSA